MEGERERWGRHEMEEMTMESLRRRWRRKKKPKIEERENNSKRREDDHRKPRESTV